MRTRTLLGMIAACALLPAGAMEIVTDPGKYPERAAWLEGLKTKLEAWADNVTALLDGPEAKWEGGKVLLRLSTEAKLAHTLTGKNIVELNPEWADTSPEEVVGACIHELAHVVQDYRSLEGRVEPYHRCPLWLSEGIADWVRWCNFEGEEGARSVDDMAKDRPKHDDSYRITASFLNWIVRKKGKEFIARLNKICRDGGYCDKDGDA